jgi:hypothetical protein
MQTKATHRFVFEQKRVKKKTIYEKVLTHKGTFYAKLSYLYSYK